MLASFSFKPMPALIFGPGSLAQLPHLVSNFGSGILVLTGSKSFLTDKRWPLLQAALSRQGCTVVLEQITAEPSPKDIDRITDRQRDRHIDVVVAIGGGSVIDSGKAVAAMLAEGGPVARLLEGVGTDMPSGKKVPFIAIPTTSGSGSEATSNAVISSVGPGGFKKSLRHDNYIPNAALIDPELTLSCPRQLTVSCGMDTFTQLVEAYLSTHSSPLTDTLALEGIAVVQRSLERACTDGHDLAARADMAYAAYLSGIVLANAGLGVVHGFASAIGGLFHIPHGVVCGTLMAATNQATLVKLRATGKNPAALKKYTLLGKLFSSLTGKPDSQYQDAFIAKLERLTAELAISDLSDYGITTQDIDTILEQSKNKYNPATLDEAELSGILRSRIRS